MNKNIYEVKSGDTLWAICKKQFGLTSNSDIANKVAEIAKINSVFDGQIDIGQKLNLGFEQEQVALSENKQEHIEVKQTVQADAVNEATSEKKSFTKIVESYWSKISCFKATEAEKDNAQKTNDVELPVTVVTEKVIPEGHKEAPNGKITKVYTREEINQIIEDTSLKHGVDSSLVKAIIKVESVNDQFAKSKKGAQGLMQLMPNGAGKGLENAYDAKANIERGVQEFARLRRFYGNNDDALRAYNWGEGNYNKYLSGEKTRLPKETADYPEKVLSYYAMYSRTA